MYTPPLVDGVRAHPCDLILAWAVEKVGARCVCDLGAGIGRDLLQMLNIGLIDYGYGVDNGAHDDFRIGNVDVSDELAGRIYLEEGSYQAALSHDPPQPFDIAITNNVLEHVDYPDDLLLVAMTLAPYAVHTLPFERNHWDPYHRHYWDVEGLAALCDRWGEVVTADQIPGGNMFVLMKRRVA